VYLSTQFSRLQSGQVYNYAFTIILFTAFYLHSMTLNPEFLIILPILLFIFA
jgi:hypothetical protein